MPLYILSVYKCNKLSCDMGGGKNILLCTEKEDPVAEKSQGSLLQQVGKEPSLAPESPRKAVHCAGAIVRGGGGVEYP